MGLSESTLKNILKPFECLNHCKVTAKSPCCKFCCGDESCNFGIDTHENNSESDESENEIQSKEI